MALQLGLLGGLVLLLLINFFRPQTITDFEAYCPFGGIQSFISYAVGGSLACSMTTTQIFIGLALFGGIVLFSKLFCSYLCPLGTITEWLGKLGRKMKVNITPVGIADKVLRSFKYVLVFVVIYFTGTTSELFCKVFDPYFATVTGYGADTSILWATVAIAALIFGSFFIRQFWCRYACPMGALSNIFSYFVMLATVLLVYLAIVALGIELAWWWPLVICCVIAYFLEIFNYERKIFPVVKISRDVKTCSNCTLCDKACPHGIKVSSVSKVTNIDCTLCGDCVAACEKEKSLSYNGKRWIWLPAGILSFLVVLGIVLGSITEIPTIDERWGSEEQLANAKVLVQYKTDNIKCYGSSKAFANQMQKVKGILGVATYVGTKHVKIFYNPEVISEKEVKKAIYSPYTAWVNKPAREDAVISSLELGLNNFYGRNDYNVLKYMLKGKPGVYGFETEWGEPVLVRLFYNAAVFKPEELKTIVAIKEFAYVDDNSESNRKVNVNPDFKFMYLHLTDDKFTPIQIEHRWFKPVSQVFKKKEFNPELLDSLIVEAPQANIVKFARQFQFMGRHLSGDSAIVKFSTRYTGSIPEAVVTFLKTKTTKDRILTRMKADSLVVALPSGEVNKYLNEVKVKVAE